MYSHNLFWNWGSDTDRQCSVRFLCAWDEISTLLSETVVCFRHLAGQTLHSFAGIGIGCSTLGAALKKASERGTVRLIQFHNVNTMTTLSFYQMQYITVICWWVFPKIASWAHTETLLSSKPLFFSAARCLHGKSNPQHQIFLIFDEASI